jgi:hypothetical protein
MSAVMRFFGAWLCLNPGKARRLAANTMADSAKRLREPPSLLAEVIAASFFLDFGGIPDARYFDTLYDWRGVHFQPDPVGRRVRRCRANHLVRASGGVGRYGHEDGGECWCRRAGDFVADTRGVNQLTDTVCYCRKRHQMMRGGFMNLSRDVSLTGNSSHHPAVVEAVLNYLAPIKGRPRTYTNEPPT